MQLTSLRSLHMLTSTLIAATCLTVGCDSDSLDAAPGGTGGEEYALDDLDHADYVGPEVEPAEPHQVIENDDGTLIAEGSDFRVRIHRSRRVAELNVSRDHLSQWYGLPFSRWSPEATARLYEVFADDFDFIVFVPASEGQHPAITNDGDSVRVRNDVEGLGLSLFDHTQLFGSEGRLQHAVMLGGIKHVVGGPSLRELGERWGNAFLPSASVDHFGFADVGGQLGGCSPDQIEPLGDNQYFCDFDGTTNWSPDGATHNDRIYARLELYLMGLVSPAGIPAISWADDAQWVDQEHGIFEGSLRSATMDELVQDHGARFPRHDESQRHFRTLFVVVSGGDLIDMEMFNSFDLRVREFAAPKPVINSVPGMYNFFEAASGLAKLDAEDLDASLL
ncbi:MAG TPA: hypothetical protein VM869_26110 [Enhygromyxa sp.]|nr:hypothetical protein [Enhygromyxa sp.]